MRASQMGIEQQAKKLEDQEQKITSLMALLSSAQSGYAIEAQ